MLFCTYFTLAVTEYWSFPARCWYIESALEGSTSDRISKVLVELGLLF